MHFALFRTHHCVTLCPFMFTGTFCIFHKRRPICMNDISTCSSWHIHLKMYTLIFLKIITFKEIRTVVLEQEVSTFYNSSQFSLVTFFKSRFLLCYYCQFLKLSMNCRIVDDLSSLRQIKGLLVTFLFSTCSMERGDTYLPLSTKVKRISNYPFDRPVTK